MDKPARRLPLSQSERILDYLKSGRTLTRLNSWEKLGILEAPARICELRKAGHPILTEMVEIKNNWGEKVRIALWSMPDPQPQRELFMEKSA